MLLILICINYRYVIPILLISDSSPLQSLIVLPFIGALSDCIGIFVTTLPVLIPISTKPRRLIYMHLHSRRSTSEKMAGRNPGESIQMNRSSIIAIDSISHTLEHKHIH